MKRKYFKVASAHFSAVATATAAGISSFPFWNSKKKENAVLVCGVEALEYTQQTAHFYISLDCCTSCVYTCAALCHAIPA